MGDSLKPAPVASSGSTPRVVHGEQAPGPQSPSTATSGAAARPPGVPSEQTKHLVAVPDASSPLAKGLSAKSVDPIARMPQPARWEPLFDGTPESWKKWKYVGAGSFELDHGVLIARPPDRFQLGMAYFTERKLGHGVLRVVFASHAPTDNSGVFVRMPEPPAGTEVPLSYEVNIHDVDPRPGHATGAIYGFAGREDPHDGLHFADGQRHQMCIVLEERRTRVFIDGKLLTVRNEGEPVAKGIRQRDDPPLEPPRPAAGYVGLQVHFPFYPFTTSDVHFYEVAWGPLPDGSDDAPQRPPR